MTVATGVVTDETGSANFRLRNDHTTHLKKGITIALRNGKSNVVEDHILLDLDRFGKVSLEPEAKVNPNTNAINISDETWERKKKSESRR